MTAHPDRREDLQREPSRAGAPVLVTDLASKTLAVKEGETFLYCDLEGNLDHGGDYGLGLYHRDTRYLSQFRMTISGRDPVLLSSSSERAYMSHVDLTNPDLYEGDEIAVPQQTLNIRRIRAINGRMFERVRVKNYNGHAVSLDLAFSLGADFADIFEVRGMMRDDDGELEAHTITDRRVDFTRLGRDGVQRLTRVEFASTPDRIEDEDDGTITATFRLHLGP
jgi:glycogen debranching enzyme